MMLNPKNLPCCFLLLFVAGMVLFACGTQHKAKKIEKDGVETGVTFAGRRDFKVADSVRIETKDSIKVTTVEGRDMFVMRTILDEDGYSIANESLEEVVITARFRHVAERGGMLTIEFQIIVPERLQDSRWQLQYQPTLLYEEDSLKLDKVYVTGSDFRKKQYRGYQQYQRFLDRIITDSTYFIDGAALEKFLKRYIPQVYAFKTDSSYVSDEEFEGYMGVSEREAVDHYTRKARIRYNESLKSKKGAKFNRLVKSPIQTKGIRLDTVIQAISGNYVYNYSQEMLIAGREKLKKVDVVLDGEVFEVGNKVMDIPRTEPITFYISSLSALVDGTERYIMKIVERQAAATARYNIAFPVSQSDIVPDFGDNREQISLIKGDLYSCLSSDEFILDSVIVSASSSPEGSYAQNASLSGKRSSSISLFFRNYIDSYVDSVKREDSRVVSMDETFRDESHSHLDSIVFLSLSVPENWAGLDRMIEEDTVMTITQKEEYYAFSDMKDFDARENRMKAEPWYSHLKNDLYPKLRAVDFRFVLHRKGMVKDTVHTTEIDRTYMDGIQAMRDREYVKALKLLGPYNDYNTAVAFCALDKNASALNILEKEPESARREYLLAIVYSRMGDDEKAVNAYLNSCRLDRQYVYRGNLDPEIAVLIKRYGLNKEVE